MKKAVIFDMDGVIIDSEQIWKLAEEEVFTMLGVKNIKKYHDITKSMTTSEVTDFWFNKFPWKGISKQKVESKVIKKVICMIKQRTCEISGIKNLITSLKEKEIKIGLATNSPQIIIPIVLNKLNIENLFDVVNSSENEELGKPHPNVYLTTLKKLNINANQCLAIEDSNSGIMAAKRAGISVIGFTNKHVNYNLQNTNYLLHTHEEFNMEWLN